MLSKAGVWGAATVFFSLAAGMYGQAASLFWPGLLMFSLGAGAGICLVRARAFHELDRMGRGP